MVDPDPPTRPAPWVGRATARPATPPPTYEAPDYGPPTYGPGVDPRRVVVVRVPRRRSGGKVALVTIGILAAVCAVGGTAAILLLGWLGHGPAAGLGAAAPPGLNTPVRDGQFEFVVTGASCGHPSVGESFVTRTANGQFCLVTLTVRNIGTDGRPFAEAFQQAIGPDGTTWSTDTTAGVIVNRSGVTAWSTVDPGEAVSGTIVFDIPKTTSIAQLDLHDSPLSGGVRVTLG